MKKFFSFAAFALLASAMTFSLSACRDKDNDDAAANNDSGSQNQTEDSLTPEGRAAVAIDLGLPSGTKWADRNIGADKPETTGLYFAWGETAEKNIYSWNTYLWGDYINQLTKYCNKSENGKDGYTDVENPSIGKELTELLPDDDVAIKKWGGKWIMPTLAQFEELIANTNNVWVEDYNGTGISGYKFTNKNNASKFIFLPATGYRYDDSYASVGSYGDYWSRSFELSYPYHAEYLYFYNGGVGVNMYYRYSGRTVRPVQK